MGPCLVRPLWGLHQRQTTIPMSSALHASVHSGVPTSMSPPATASAQALWPPYDRTGEILPTHTTHIAPTCPASVGRAHTRIPSSSLGATDVFADPSYQSSIVYASSPYLARPRSDASDPYFAQQTLSSAFNSTMVLTAPPIHDGV